MLPCLIYKHSAEELFKLLLSAAALSYFHKIPDASGSMVQILQQACKLSLQSMRESCVKSINAQALIQEGLEWSLHQHKAGNASITHCAMCCMACADLYMPQLLHPYFLVCALHFPLYAFTSVAVAHILVFADSKSLVSFT